MENTDLVSEFFNINNQEEPSTVPVNDIMNKGEQFENAGDKIESILTDIGLSQSDSDYVYMSLKDAYENLSAEDGDETIDFNGSFTAEVADILSFVLPEKSEDELADAARKIIDAVVNQAPIDLSEFDDQVGPEEAAIMNDIEAEEAAADAHMASEDFDTEDDLDPTFWD